MYCLCENLLHMIGISMLIVDRKFIISHIFEWQKGAPAFTECALLLRSALTLTLEWCLLSVC